MSRTLVTTLVFVVLLAIGCGGQSGQGEGESAFNQVSVPITSPAGQPRLVADGDRLLMSWIEEMDGGSALRFAYREAGTWSDPLTAAWGDDWFVNWADTPGVVPVADGGLMAFYLQRTGPQPYAYGIRVVTSRNGGRSWSEPVIPHQDGIQAEFGFVSIVPDTRGGAQLYWLDGSAMPADHAGHHGPMALRTARISESGVLDGEALLDERTCECCPTAALQTQAGTIVAYRDRSEDEIRDIALVRSSPEGSSAPYIPHPDGWQIAGCPVNGPALAGRDDDVVLAWFSGVDGGAVHLARSADGGTSWADPVRIDHGSPLGRVDVALASSNHALVTWIERTADGASLELREVHGGGTSRGVRVADVLSDRATGMPRMALVGDSVYVAWVDAEAKAVRLAAGAIDSIQRAPLAEN